MLRGVGRNITCPSLPRGGMNVSHLVYRGQVVLLVSFKCRFAVIFCLL